MTGVSEAQTLERPASAKAERRMAAVRFCSLRFALLTVRVVRGSRASQETSVLAVCAVRADLAIRGSQMPRLTAHGSVRGHLTFLPERMGTREEELSECQIQECTSKGI